VVSRGHRKAPGVSRAFLFDVGLVLMGLLLLARSVAEMVGGAWFDALVDLVVAGLLVTIAVGLTPTDD
jgi:uncharacterized membrane protein YjjP (DUF1212 family)